MPTLEERVAYLEGRVGEQAAAFDDLRGAVRLLDQRVHAFEQRVDHRFDTVDRRFEALERRLDGGDEKVTRYFVWLVGFQVTTLAAVVAALVSR
jgi:uncharacterized coiled-coil protein SlyX